MFDESSQCENHRPSRVGISTRACGRAFQIFRSKNQWNFASNPFRALSPITLCNTPNIFVFILLKNIRHFPVPCNCNIPVSVPVSIPVSVHCCLSRHHVVFPPIDVRNSIVLLIFLKALPGEARKILGDMVSGVSDPLSSHIQIL